MECLKIKEMLSEYIKDTLGVQSKKLVQEHLASCKDCSRELESLKAYLRTMSSLEQVKAPEDFLERVHERIERYSVFGKVMQKLFIPFQIKIPLEAVGVAVTVVLLIYILNIMQPVSEIGVVPLVTELDRTVKKPAEESIKLDLREKAVPLGPVVESLPIAPTEEAKKKSIELALLVKSDKFVPKDEAGIVYDSKGPSDMSKPSGRLSSTSEVVKKLETKEEEIEYEAEIPVEKPLQKENQWHLYYPDETVSRIKHTIQLVKGKVLSVEKEVSRIRSVKDVETKGTVRNGEKREYNRIEMGEELASKEIKKEGLGGREIEMAVPHTITAEIPAHNYGLFLEKLGQLGQLQEPLPTVTVEDEETVQVMIQLLFSQ